MKKRIFTYLFSVIFLVSMPMCLGVYANASCTGTGSVDSPYQADSFAVNEVAPISGDSYIGLSNPSDTYYLHFYLEGETSPSITACISSGQKKIRLGGNSNYDGSTKLRFIEQSGMTYKFELYEKPLPDPDPDPEPISPLPSHVHDWIEGEIYTPTQTTDGLGGIYCKTCGTIKESWPISAYGYSINDYATPMINAAKAGQTITFELGEWNSFPKAFMEKIAAKSMEGVAFVFHYKWNHVKQEITIPFGTTVDTQFDWYGPAKMAELYGAN